MKPQPHADTPPSQPEEDRAWLSALADGDAEAVDRACGLWRDDAQARSDWHAYHLIGDVMRSEDLARAAPRDAAFLAGVRARLALEPVVLAPVPVAAPARRRQPWLVPVAAAAGFVMVAGVLVVARLGEPGAGAPNGSEVAQRSPAAAPVGSGSAMLRSAEIDQYVNAHRAVGGGVAMSAPGAVRRVDITVPVTPAR